MSECVSISNCCRNEGSYINSKQQTMYSHFNLRNRQRRRRWWRRREKKDTKEIYRPHSITYKYEREKTRKLSITTTATAKSSKISNIFQLRAVYTNNLCHIVCTDEARLKLSTLVVTPTTNKNNNNNKNI